MLAVFNIPLAPTLAVVRKVPLTLTCILSEFPLHSVSNCVLMYILPEDAHVGFFLPLLHDLVTGGSPELSSLGHWLVPGWLSCHSGTRGQRGVHLFPVSQGL